MMGPVRSAVDAPRRTLAIAAAVVAVAALAATQLGSGSLERLLAGAHSKVGSATAAQEKAFGGEPIVVDLRGNLDTMLDGGNLRRLLGLETRLRRLDGVQTVVGPGTFVDQAVTQMNRVVVEELGPAAERADRIAAKAVQLAKAHGVKPDQFGAIDEAARLRALGGLRKRYEDLLVRFGYVGFPALDNKNFVSQLVFGARTAPKARFAWMFPDRRHALVVVRLRSGLSDGRARALGAQIDSAVRATRLPRGTTPLIAGAPLVVAHGTASVRDELLRLLPLGLVALAVALLVGLGLRARAVHLLVPAGLGVLVTAGLSWPLGLGFTPATLAALPVLLGLALDYAVQLQARYWALRRDGAAPAEAAVGAVEQLGPTLLLAGGAMVVGFLILTVSPVPLVDRLGITLALGVVSSLAAVLLVGPPLMVAADRPDAAPPSLGWPRLTLSPRARLAALSALVGVALAGTVLSADTPVQSDLRKLADANMAELQHLEALQRDLGTSGQIRIAVSGRDVADPRVLQWMSSIEPKILGLDRGLRAGPNLAAILGAGGSTPTDAATVQRLLRLIPPAFTGAVLTPDHRRAELSFGVPLTSAADQARLVDRMQRLLDTAPGGAHAQVAGLLAASGAGVSALQGERPWLLLLAALLIFALLLAVRRRVDRAFLPLVPALLAAGATALVVRALDVSLSPLSAGLDPLVLAVGVEFGLLLEARYREERALGHAPEAAAAEARRSIGSAVVVAAGAVALGFLVLALSSLTVLRQFGLFAALELGLSVGAALAIVPALCAGLDTDPKPAEQGRPASVPRPRVTATVGGG
jgi:uncharacterized protein